MVDRVTEFRKEASRAFERLKAINSVDRIDPSNRADYYDRLMEGLEWLRASAPISLREKLTEIEWQKVHGNMINTGDLTRLAPTIYFLIERFALRDDETADIDQHILNAAQSMLDMGQNGAAFAVSAHFAINNFELEFRRATGINDTTALVELGEAIAKIGMALRLSNSTKLELARLIKTLSFRVADLEAENARLQTMLKKPATDFRHQFTEAFTKRMGEEAATVLASWLKPMGAIAFTGVAAAVGFAGTALTPKEAAAVEQCMMTYVQIAAERSDTT